MLDQHTVQKLREMYLTGMADAFAAQAGQPDVHTLIFEERFGLLVDSEWTFRQNRKLRRLLKEAKLRLPACIEDIDYEQPGGLDKAFIRQLLEVEEAFRTLKQTLELRPVYHRLSRRIQAHVLLCWLALLLIRVIETRVEERLGQRYTWPRLRDELSRMHLGIFEGPAGVVWQRTETTSFQRQILSAVGNIPR